MEQENKRYYLKEFQYYNGECFITFNIVDINTEKMIITLAVSNQGKISVIEYDLFRDKENNLFFEYSCEHTKIDIEDFED